MISYDDVINASEAFWDDKITLNDLEAVYSGYMSCSEQYRMDNAVRLCKELTNIICSKADVKDFYFMLSAMFKMTMIPEVYYELIQALIDDTDLTLENKYFAYCQLAADRFKYPIINSEETRELLDELYEQIYQGFLADAKEICVQIPKKERTPDFVIILVSQVLSLNHGPTKTLLDRCSILSEAMSKKVFIINTNSVLPEYGEINWFDQKAGNWLNDLSRTESLEWKGKKYRYLQLPREISQARLSKELLEIIKKERPSYIVSIGGESITADICACVVPVLTVTLVPSERAQTRTTFQMTGHKISDEDREWLNHHGFNSSHFIEGLFTSDFKPQSTVLTRADLKLPPDKSVCIVVGYRLDEEVDESFLDVIRELANNNIYTAFMGKFNRYETITTNDPLLREYTINLGFQQDALAVYECCDIYLNPRRLGGGTSVAEAMYKGLPAVTIGYGDVATGAGDDFTVRDYREMIERVLILAADKECYDRMSLIARKRAAKLTDRQHEFVKIINEMESRMD